MHHRAIAFMFAMALLPSFAQAQPNRAAEQKRREILDKLGLGKAPLPPPSAVPKDQGETPKVQAPAANGEAAQEEDAVARKPAPPSFRRHIQPWLKNTCGGCHQKSGPAGSTAFVIGEGLANDHARSLRQVNTAAPARSALVMEATGHNHGGGVVAAPRSAEIRRLVAWIAAGALLEDTAANTTAANTTVAKAPQGSLQQPQRRARRPAQAASPTEAEPATPLAAAPSETPPETKVPSPTPTPTTSAAPAFSEAVHGVLTARCQTCHNDKGMASRSRFVLNGDVTRDYGPTSAVVIAGDANTSPLLIKATGQAHMVVFDRTSDAYKVIAAWINAGAQGPFLAAPTNVQAEGGTPANAPPPARLPAQPLAAVASPALPAANPHGGAHAGGFNLPMGLRLNGRFDMAFERRGLLGHPFASGQTQFQNYHHFLFLTRDEADDPITFTVELVALTFWEAHLRVTPRQARVQVRLKAGKLIVPFGAEPLFHQSYGGLQGFDQRVLPVFWAQNGFGARLNTNVQDVAVMGDIYAVRGYALRDGEVLNLQSHFSPNDDVRPSYGVRLNLSWLSLSGYYSLIVNGLGLGRTLMMQALDLNMWRWPGVPVLERMTFGFGFLRADVSGGGAGSDYYHFASYAQARLYLSESVFVQYRQGLRTFNNRRGLLQDSTRFTSDDGSAHNVGVVWRQRGLSVGAYQFWNLEKVNEVRDDFFRFMVAYDF